MISQSPVLPLDIRLRAIEAQLFGESAFSSSSSSSNRTRNGGETSTSTPRKTILTQIRESEEIFERLAGESEGLKRLIEGYEQYLPLLNQSTTSTNDNNHNTEDGRISESDLTNDRTKLTIILESSKDLIDAERELREIEILKGKDAHGSGDLENLLPLKSNLISSIQQTQTDSNELMRVKAQISDLLNRYNEFTSTTSDLFIDLHHNLQYLEDRVARLERRKKKEIEGRF